MQVVQCRGQGADIDVRTMVSGISIDEHAAHTCVVSHMSGPPDVINLQSCVALPLPSISTGEPRCSLLVHILWHVVECRGCSCMDCQLLCIPMSQQSLLPLRAEQESKGSAAAAAVAVTTHSGDRIFLSQPRGVLLTVDTATLQIVDAVKVGAGGGVSPRNPCTTNSATGHIRCTAHRSRVHDWDARHYPESKILAKQESIDVQIHCQTRFSVRPCSVAPQVPGAPRILGLTLNRPGSLLLALCSDRVIRLFEVSKRPQPPAALHSADAVRRALSTLSVRLHCAMHTGLVHASSVGYCKLLAPGTLSWGVLITTGQQGRLTVGGEWAAGGARRRAVAHAAA